MGQLGYNLKKFPTISDGLPLVRLQQYIGLETHLTYRARPFGQ